MSKRTQRMQRTGNTEKVPEFTGRIRYTLTNDYMFKVCLQENQEALKNLIATLMQIPVETIQSLRVLNSIIPGG